MNTIEPIEKVQLNDSEVTLLGTAHVSKSSAEAVEQLLDSGTYNAVAVELCPSRYNAIINPDALAQMDLFKVIKEGGLSIDKSVLMPPWAAVMSDAEIKAVVKYLRELCECG